MRPRNICGRPPVCKKKEIVVRKHVAALAAVVLGVGFCDCSNSGNTSIMVGTIKDE